eukprot:m.175754 g.175754  ORF g.175754 m.175754 type:complete len:117 (-) comp14622_c0_seq10:1149-1499(-)
MSASSHSAATRGGAAATDEKKQLREYFQSHVEGKLLKQMPQDILSQTTPATQLLEKKKELEEVEDALEAQKEVQYCFYTHLKLAIVCAHMVLFHFFVRVTHTLLPTHHLTWLLSWP